MDWYHKLSIKTKLLGNFSALILLTLIISSSAIYSLRQAQNVAASVHVTLLERFELVDTIRTVAYELNIALVGFLNSIEFGNSLKVQEEVRKIGVPFEENVLKLPSGVYPQQVQQLEEDAAALMKLCQGTLEPLVIEGKTTQALTFYEHEVKQHVQRILDNLNYIRDGQIDEVNRDVDLAADSTPLFIVSIITVISIVFSLVIAFATAGYITRALTVLSNNIKLMERQDFSQAIKLKYNDEFGNVGQTLEALRVQQAKIMKDLVALSGRISKEMERALASRTSSSTSEISDKVDGMEKVANDATNSMERAVKGMEDLAQNTSGLETVLGDISHHVNEVNAQIEQIAAAAEEQTTASNEISQSMQDLTNSAREVANIAKENLSVINNTLGEIDILTNTMSKFKF